MAAPKTGPRSCPVPPKIAIRTGIKERRGSKAILGSIYFHFVAMIAPVAPIKHALMAKVIVFTIVALMPI